MPPPAPDNQRHVAAHTFQPVEIDYVFDPRSFRAATCKRIFAPQFGTHGQHVRQRSSGRRAFGSDYVRIGSNENPMGPSKEGIEALVKVAPQAWRYSPNGEEGELLKTIAEIEGVPADHIALYGGSSSSPL